MTDLLRYLFYAFSFPILWITLFLDVFVHMLSFRYLEINTFERFSSFCIKVLIKLNKKKNGK